MLVEKGASKVEGDREGTHRADAGGRRPLRGRW